MYPWVGADQREALPVAGYRGLGFSFLRKVFTRRRGKRVWCVFLVRRPMVCPSWGPTNGRRTVPLLGYGRECA